MNNHKLSWRLIAIALSIIVSLGLAPVSAAAETPDYSWYDANTAAHRFEINSAAQLKGLADIVNGNHGAAFSFAGREVCLMADIDLSGYDNWTPIGFGNKTFDGAFIGNSHAINGLTINEPTQTYVGLFGLMVGSVSGLTLTNVNIIGSTNVGAIAGETWGSISRCAVVGGTVSGNQYTGGIVGKVNMGSLTSCFATCDIRGIGFSPYYAGGVTGRVEWDGSLSDCYATGSVRTGEGFSGMFGAAGGVVGSMNSGSIQRCFATGEVAGTVDTGGVVGAYSGGTLTNVAALNNRVAGAPDASIYGGPKTGRVAGRSGEATNAIAFSGLILVNGGNGLNGTDKSAAEIKAEGFFEANGFSTPTWQNEAEKLPILAGFAEGLQDGELPAHIGSPMPSAPQALTAEPNDGSVKLTWSAPASSGASDISRYEVRKNNDSWTSVGLAMTYTFTGLTNGTIYTFEVRAVNSYGNGAAASAQRVPVSSGHIAAIPGDRSAILNWVTPPALIGKIQLYQVRYNNGSWIIPDEDYLHTYYGLANGVNYTFEIQGIGMDGTSPGVLFGSSVQAMPVGKPLEPANPVAVPGDRQIQLSWENVYSDEGSPVLRYEVSQDGGANWVSVGMNMSYTFTGLVNGTAYPLQVRAVNAIGAGNTAAISATPRQPPAIISANNQSFPYGSGGTFTVSATGTPTIAYTLTGQPVGVSINETTGSVTVEKTVPADVYPFTITAANGSPPDAVQNFTLTITPRTPQLSDLQYTAPSNRTYDGTGTGIGPVTDKNAIGLTCTVYYQGISGTSYPRSQTPPKNAGNYEVIASIAGSTNINAAELSLGTYRIIPKSINVTPTAGQNKIYGQPDPQFAYTLSSTLAAGDTMTGALTRAAGENVGAYSIALGTLTAGSNYTLSLSGSVSFTINPKADASFSIAAIPPQTYTGSAITPQPTVKDGSIVLTKNVDFTYSYGNNTNAGVSAAVNITGIGNYAGSTGSAIFTISKAIPTLTLTATPPATQTRPGSVELLAALPPDATGTLTFRAGMDTIATVTLPLKTASFTPTGAANAYSFTVEYSGDGNYEGKTSAALEYSFTKSSQAALSATNGTVNYADTLDLSTLVSGGSGTGAFSFAIIDGPADLDGATLTATGVGTVHITATKAADNDYDAKSAVLTVTVIPRVITFTVAPVEPQTYTGSVITPEPEVRDTDVLLTEGIDFTYGYSDNTNIGNLAAVNITGIGNYAGSTGSATFSIVRAAPSILTPPVVSDNIYAGTALSKISLTGGEASVSGHFEWVNPSAAAVSGENTFEARFVPDDIVNYLEIEGISIAFTAKNRPSGNNPRIYNIRPSQPASASITAAAQVTNGRAALTITSRIARSAIDQALTDAKAMGNTANGIRVTISVAAKDASVFALTLEGNALNRLLNAGVKSFNVSGLPVNLGFDTESLRQIRTQSGGDVVIIIKPVAVTGLRNAYEINITTTKTGKAFRITSLGKGSVTLSIAAAPGKNESGGYLYGAYVGADNKINRIANSVYDANSKRVILSINHFSVYGVGYSAPSATFVDIAQHWAKGSIDYIVARGLISGTSGTAFSPDAAITRGILAAALGRLSGADVSGYSRTSSFRDVETGSVIQPYIEWAYKKGIMQGAGNRQFAPDKALTREEIAVILQNYAKVTGYRLPVTREAAAYADSNAITYKIAVKAMQQAGVLMGKSDNKFNPKSYATRAEVSAMLYRYIKLTVDPATAQGWALNDDGQYLYYQNGAAVTGWQTIDGVEYYFNSTGSFQTDSLQNR